jgi:hypothetical protein
MSHRLLQPYQREEQQQGARGGPPPLPHKEQDGLGLILAAAHVSYDGSVTAALPLVLVLEPKPNVPEDPIVLIVRTWLLFIVVSYGSSHTGYQIGAQLRSYNLQNTTNKTHLYEVW